MVRFIVADDEVLALDDFVTSIRWDNFGFQLAGTASNGKQALELVRKVRPEVVFTDIKMPVMDGIELCGKIHQEFPEIKMVLLTAYRDFEYAQKAFEYGVTDYILKNQVSEERMTQLLGRLKDQFAEKEKLSFSSGHTARQSMILNPTAGVDEAGVKLPKNSICLLAYFRKPLIMSIGKEEMKSRLPSIEIGSSQSFLETESLLKLYDILWIENNARVFLFSCRDESIKEETIPQQLRSFIGGLRTYYEEQYRLTVTVYYSLCGDSLNSIRKAIIDMQEFAGKSMYAYEFSFEPWQSKAALYPTRKWNRQQVKTAISGIETGVKQEEPAKVAENLEILRKMYTEPTYYAPAFIYVCNTLYDLLNSLLVYRKMGTAEELIDSDQKQIGTCINARKTFEWFSEQVEELCGNENSVRHGTYSRKISDAIAYVQQNYMVKMTLADAAERAGFSETYFNSLFKKETGISFSAFLLNTRIDAAKYMIRHTDAKVYEIAEKCGFSSSQYFSQVFEKETGYTPLNYKRQLEVEG